MMIRINGLDTHYAYRDVVDVVENCPRLDMILIPKTGVPQDVYAIDMLVTQIEQYKKREKRIGFECLIETALGMANVEAIAQSSKRLEALSFGVADYAASTRARTVGIGGPHPDYGVLTDKDADGNRHYYWNDPWHFALSRMMVACRAYGLRPIDGPFGDFSDPDGYTAAAKRAGLRASYRYTPDFYWRKIAGLRGVEYPYLLRTDNRSVSDAAWFHVLKFVSSVTVVLEKRQTYAYWSDEDVHAH